MANWQFSTALFFGGNAGRVEISPSILMMHLAAIRRNLNGGDMPLVAEPAIVK